MCAEIHKRICTETVKYYDVNQKVGKTMPLLYSLTVEMWDATRLFEASWSDFH